MKRFAQAIAILLLFVCRLSAANEEYAVVRVPSHGASATVIETNQGYSWLLGCAHAYRGDMRGKRMVLDIPSASPGPHKPVASELYKIDYQMDLSLILLHDGPLDYVCPIAPAGWRDWDHAIWSVGYDEMKFPATMRLAHIVSEDYGLYYTRERPWHGRSGGALIDKTIGRLIGVVQGYEIEGRGMYISLETVRRFVYTQSQSQPCPPQR